MDKTCKMRAYFYSFSCHKETMQMQLRSVWNQVSVHRERWGVQARNMI